MKAEKIKIIKDWLKPKLVCDIQVFLGFANFIGNSFKASIG